MKKNKVNHAITQPYGGLSDMHLIFWIKVAHQAQGDSYFYSRKLWSPRFDDEKLHVVR